MKWLIHLYPRSWRDRYGDEFAALLEDCPTRPQTFLDVVRGCLDAHWTAGRLRKDLRMLRYALLALAAVVVFVVSFIVLNTAIHFVVAYLLIPALKGQPLWEAGGVGSTGSSWSIIWNWGSVLLALIITTLAELRLRERLRPHLSVDA